MGIKSTNINKMDHHLPSQHTKHKKIIFNILLQIILKNIHKIFGQIQQTNNTIAY